MPSNGNSTIDSFDWIYAAAKVPRVIYGTTTTTTTKHTHNGCGVEKKFMCRLRDKREKCLKVKLALLYAYVCNPSIQTATRKELKRELQGKHFRFK